MLTRNWQISFTDLLPAMLCSHALIIIALPGFYIFIHVYLVFLYTERLGYVRNPRSLMEGTETLCRDDIGDLPGSPEHLWLKRKRQLHFASGFCIPEPLPVHTGIKGRQVHPLIRFYAEEPRRVPGNQRWFKIVAWGHNVSVPSIRERGLRT